MRNFINFLVVLCTVLFSCFPLYACRTTIRITNQEEFDRLPSYLDSAIKIGKKDICIQFDPGKYIAQNNHFSLTGIDDPQLKISIIGNGAMLVPYGVTYKDGDDYKGSFNTGSCWMSENKDVSFWSSMKTSDELVEVIDEDNKICRIRSRQNLTNVVNPKDAYILIPQQYLARVYKITKIEGLYIYFVANDLVKEPCGWSVNNDFNYGKSKIRYKVCNIDTDDDCLKIIDGKVQLPKSYSSVKEGITYCFFNIDDCTIKYLSVEGFKVLGANYKAWKAAIFINRMKVEKCVIKNCEFYGIRSDVINVSASQNTIIEDSYFKDCYLYGVYSTNSSINTVIIGNTFESMGKAMNNSFCIACQGSKFLVKNNVLKDFSYGGIGTGLWYLSKKEYDCFGEILDNELYYTDSYVSDKEQHCLMDGGAIYLWTKNDGVSIRNNYIHDIDGMNANRGIFCDDGAYNFEIIGNVIVRIHNSYCVDSRFVSGVEEKSSPGSDIGNSNINNTIRDNVFDGNIRFVGNMSVDDNNCFWGTNYFLMSDDDYDNDIQSVHFIGENKRIKQLGFKDKIIETDREGALSLKKSREWKNIRSRFCIHN